MKTNLVFSLVIILTFLAEKSVLAQEEEIDRTDKVCEEFKGYVEGNNGKAPGEGSYFLNMFYFEEICPEPVPVKKSGQKPQKSIKDKIDELLKSINSKGLKTYAIIPPPAKEDESAPAIKMDNMTCLTTKQQDDIDLLLTEDLIFDIPNNFETEAGEVITYSVGDRVSENFEKKINEIIVKHANKHGTVNAANMLEFLVGILTDIDFLLIDSEILVNKILNKIRCAYANSDDENDEKAFVTFANTSLDILIDEPAQNKLSCSNITIYDQNNESIEIELGVTTFSEDNITINSRTSVYIFDTDKSEFNFVDINNSEYSLQITFDNKDFAQLHQYLFPYNIEKYDLQQEKIFERFEEISDAEKLTKLVEFSSCELENIPIDDRIDYIRQLINGFIYERQEDLILDLINTVASGDDTETLIAALKDQCLLQDLFSKIQDTGGKDNETRLAKELYGLYNKQNDDILNQGLKNIEENSEANFVYFGNDIFLPFIDGLTGVEFSGNREPVNYVSEFINGCNLKFRADVQQSIIVYAGNTVVDYGSKEIILWSQENIDPFTEISVYFEEPVPGHNIKNQTVRMPAIYFYYLIGEKNFADLQDDIKTALMIGTFAIGVGEIAAAKTTIQLILGIVDISFVATDYTINETICDQNNIEPGYEAFCSAWNDFAIWADAVLITGSVLDNVTSSVLRQKAKNSVNSLTNEQWNYIESHFPIKHHLLLEFKKSIKKSEDFMDEIDELFGDLIHIDGAEEIIVKHFEDLKKTSVNSTKSLPMDLGEAFKKDLEANYGDLIPVFATDPNLAKAWALLDKSPYIRRVQQNLENLHMVFHSRYIDQFPPDIIKTINDSNNKAELLDKLSTYLKNIDEANPFNAATFNQLLSNYKKIDLPRKHYNTEYVWPPGWKTSTIKCRNTAVPCKDILSNKIIPASPPLTDEYFLHLNGTREQLNAMRHQYPDLPEKSLTTIRKELLEDRDRIVREALAESPPNNSYMELPEYKQVDQLIKQNSEQAGLLASEGLMKYFDQFKLIDRPEPLANTWPGNTAGVGVFDGIYKDANGKIYFIEAKGGNSTPGSRKIKYDPDYKNQRAQQGTKEYMDDIIANMNEKVKSLDNQIENMAPGTARDELTELRNNLKKTTEDIKVAYDLEEIEYIMIRQKFKSNGDIGNIEIEKFKIWE